MKEKLTITLYGAAGNPRSLEIQPRGGVFTRGFKTPAKTQSLFGEDALKPKSETPITPKPEPTQETPSTLIEVIRSMHVSDNSSGWLIIDEILFVATTQYKMRFNHETLIDALRELYTAGHLNYRCNAFGQHTFQMTEGAALKSLLMEVDAILDGGVENG